jgi:alpha-L-fucosidase
MIWSTIIALSVLPWAIAQGGLVINPKNADDNASGSGGAESVPIDISSMFNNRAFAMTPGDADFDGIHSGYPAQFLPDANFTYSGVNYIFPQYKTAGDDNLLAQGQTITPPKGRYFAVHMLAAAETAVATGDINATYADNTTSSSPLLVDPFWDVCKQIKVSSRRNAHHIAVPISLRRRHHLSILLDQ